jgi:hypothetical protein
MVGGLQAVCSSLHVADPGQLSVVVVHAPAPSHISADVNLSPIHDCGAPQLVPAGLLAPSTQIGPPLMQEIAPLVQIPPGFVLHAMPVVQATQAPALLQTLLVPQLAPVAFAVPSLQTIDPPEQLVMPVKQGSGLVVQLWPAVHAPHVPLLQTMFVPHVVPFALLLPSAQVIVPVEQDVVPFLQLLVGFVTQLWPAVHAPHAPLLQTMFVPHEVPFALLLPSTQVIVPVAHDVVPFLQLLVGFVVHAMPAVQAPHVPLLQTRFVPHAVPFALLPPSTQVIVPVAHDVVPTLQLLVGFVVHDEPAVQAPHPPLLQTMFVPHELPFGLLPASTQVMVPVRQDVAPFLQLLVGFVVHDVPAVHALQAPPLQTRFVPQAVPFALLAPSTQVIVPVEQDVVPVLQLLVGLVAHDEPAVHALHAPLLHTPFVPHAVPFATFPVSAQATTPVTHEVVPFLHRLDGWQPTPGVQMPHVPLLQTMFVPQVVPLARFRPVSAQVIAGAQA